MTVGKNVERHTPVPSVFIDREVPLGQYCY